MTAAGIDVSGKVIVLDELQQDLISGGVPVPHGLSIIGPAQATDPLHPPPLPARFELPAPCVAGSLLFTYDDQGDLADLPSAAVPIVGAHTPDPPRDPLATVRTSHGLDELRDAIVAYLERFGG